jgi:chemotaxis protein MotB
MNGLSLEFRDQTLFAPGSAAPNPATAPVINEVMATIAKAPGNYKMVFEGHTDDTPVGRGKYRSNWDLASARGVALLDDFKARGVAEKRMSVVAFAHTRPKIKVDGLTGEALKKARAANRRVVIRLE